MSLCTCRLTVFRIGEDWIHYWEYQQSWSDISERNDVGSVNQVLENQSEEQTFLVLLLFLLRQVNCNCHLNSTPLRPSVRRDCLAYVTTPPLILTPDPGSLAPPLHPPTPPPTLLQVSAQA